MFKKKRAQLGELTEDMPSFMISLAILAILLVLVLAFLTQSTHRAEVKIEKKVLDDKLFVYISSLMLEKENGIYFRDMIRNKDPSATNLIKEKLNKPIENICKESKEVIGCQSEIIYENAKGKCDEESGEKSSYLCYFIPSKDPVAIKITKLEQSDVRFE